MSEIQANKLSPSSGTSLVIADSGDTVTLTAGANATLGGSSTTITIPSGATLNVASGGTISNSGTASGFGGNMTPAFSVVKTDQQSISNNTDTTVTFQTEVLDSNGAFASNKFTVPSGTADAKYFIFAQCYCNSGNNSDLKVASLNLFVNGSRQALSVFDARANQPRGVGMTISKILGLGAGDYVEVKAKVDTDDAGITIDGGDSQTTFGGFKITT